jgi:hypothetical protein
MSEKPYNHVDDSKVAQTLRSKTNVHGARAEGGRPINKTTSADFIVRREIGPILNNYITAYKKSGTLDEAALQREIELAKQGMPAGEAAEVDRLVLDKLRFQQEIEKTRGKVLDLKIFKVSDDDFVKSVFVKKLELE